MKHNDHAVTENNPMRKLAALIFAIMLLACCATNHPATTSMPLTTGPPHSVTLGGCTDATPGVSFNFYRGTASGGENAIPLNAAPLANCNYVDSAVTPLQTYYYTAKAYLATANPNLSSPSNEVTATIPADSQPAAPTGLSVGPISNNRVPLQWNAPPVQAGVTVNGYTVWRGSKPTLPSPSKLATVTNLNYTDAKPLKGKHFYEVKAQDTVARKKVTTEPSNIVVAVVP
jgi:hypothetical protein